MFHLKMSRPVKIKSVLFNLCSVNFIITHKYFKLIIFITSFTQTFPDFSLMNKEIIYSILDVQVIDPGKVYVRSGAEVERNYQ